MNTRILVASAVALMTVVAACEKKEDAGAGVTGAVDKAKAAASDAAKATADAAKKTADATKDAAAKTVDATKDAASKTADATKTAVDSMTASVTAWVTDTVNKQWPEAKKMLDEAGKKVGTLTGESKTKGEGLVKDLTAQIPVIEDAVKKLQATTGADAGKMMTEVKGKFDGWMTKLGELKTLVGIK